MSVVGCNLHREIALRGANVGKRAVCIPGELAGDGLVCTPAEAGHGPQEFLQPCRFSVQSLEQGQGTVTSFVLRAARSQRLGQVRPERVQTTVTHLEHASHIGRLPFVQIQIRGRCVSVDVAIALEKAGGHQRIEEVASRSRMQP